MTATHTGIVHLPDPFVLEHGEVLHAAHVGFHVEGDVGPTVVALGGISATRAPTWWSQVGPGRAIDPRFVRVVGFDWIGGGGASRGPLPGERFPAITPRDQARAIHRALDALDIDTCTVVGCSYGGMVALALGEVAANRVAHAVVIAATHRPHARATGWRTVQRRILDLAGDLEDPRRGVALARMLALVTYRDDVDLDRRWENGGAIADWLDRHATRFADRFSAESYRALSASVDLHEIEPRNVEVPITLVGFEPDALAPAWLLDELAAGLPRLAARHRVPTAHGHDGFLYEDLALDAILRTVVPPARVAA
jgi:homoserine O-acetyltransferase